MTSPGVTDWMLRHGTTRELSNRGGVANMLRILLLSWLCELLLPLSQGKPPDPPVLLMHCLPAEVSLHNAGLYLKGLRLRGGVARKNLRRKKKKDDGKSQDDSAGLQLDPTGLDLDALQGDASRSASFSNHTVFDFFQFSMLRCDSTVLLGRPDAQKLISWLQIQVTEVVRRVLIPTSKVKRQQEFLSNLTLAVKDLLGAEVELTPYGSAAAGFGTIDSDLDLQLNMGESWEAKMLGMERKVQRKLERRARLVKAAALRSSQAQSLVADPNTIPAVQKPRAAGESEEHESDLAQVADGSEETAEEHDTEDAQPTKHHATEEHSDPLSDDQGSSVATSKANSSDDCHVKQRNISVGGDVPLAHSNHSSLAARRPLRQINVWRDEKIKILNLLNRYLYQEHGLKTQAILRARVPIVNVEPRDRSCISVDISIQPRLNFGRFTVKVLQVFGGIDPRVKDLVLAVKTWSKRRSINEAFRGTLNSFSLILMVIFLLQNVHPPILPNLFLPSIHLRGQAAERSEENCLARNISEDPIWITGVDGTPKLIRFHSNVEALKGWGSENKESVSLLLARFFAYYATEFDWDRDCISVRMARPLPVSETSFVNKTSPLCIEDCLDDSNNVARSVGPAGRKRIQEEFERAFSVMCSKGDVEALLEECEALASPSQNVPRATRPPDSPVVPTHMPASPMVENSNTSFQLDEGPVEGTSPTQQREIPTP